MTARFLDVFLQKGRLGEWISSVALMLFVAFLMLPGNSFTVEGGQPGFALLGFSEIAVAVPMTIIATARMVALVVNGAWRRSPHLRVAGSACSSASYMVISYATLLPYMLGRTDSVDPVAGVSLVMLMADMVAAYRAGSDAGSNARADAGEHKADRFADRRDVGDNAGDGFYRHQGREEDARRDWIDTDDEPSPIFASRRSGTATGHAVAN